MKNEDVFEQAYTFMAAHEGDFVNNPNDKGGATKYGISLRFLTLENIDINNDGFIDIKDIHDLTLGSSKTIFYNSFWRNSRIYLLPSEPIQIKCFDFAVHMGPTQAIKLLQRVINFLIYPKPPIKEDGQIGIITRSKIEQVEEEELIYLYINEVILFYRQIILNNPSQIEYLKGWLRRAHDMRF